MTVAELMAKLATLPQDMLVYIPDNRDGWTDPSMIEIRPFYVDEDDGHVFSCYNDHEFDIKAAVIV